MNIFEILRNLTPPKLGKFGEYLARKYWEGVGSSVAPEHRKQTDFYVNGVPYDVKATVISCNKNKTYRNKPPKYYGRRKGGVHILRIEVYADCAVLAEEGKSLLRLNGDQLEKHWHEHQKPSSRRKPAQKNSDQREPNTFIPNNTYKKWLNEQKKRTGEICAKHGVKARIISRNGEETQNDFGNWGPDNLIAPNLKKEDATVCLWTEGCSFHQVIAFPHSDIGKLPLHWHKPPNKKRIQTMCLQEFKKFHGKYCFDSLEDFEQKFVLFQHNSATQDKGREPNAPH